MSYNIDFVEIVYGTLRMDEKTLKKLKKKGEKEEMLPECSFLDPDEDWGGATKEDDALPDELANPKNPVWVWRKSLWWYGMGAGQHSWEWFENHCLPKFDTGILGAVLRVTWEGGDTVDYVHLDGGKVTYLDIWRILAWVVEHGADDPEFLRRMTRETRRD